MHAYRMNTQKLLRYAVHTPNPQSYLQSASVHVLFSWLRLDCSCLAKSRLQQLTFCLSKEVCTLVVWNWKSVLQSVPTSTVWYGRIRFGPRTSFFLTKCVVNWAFNVFKTLVCHNWAFNWADPSKTAFCCSAWNTADSLVGKKNLSLDLSEDRQSHWGESYSLLMCPVPWNVVQAVQLIKAMSCCCWRGSTLGTCTGGGWCF